MLPKIFAQPGVPRDPFEKIADAAQVHKYTGIAPSVALHIPWDKVESFSALRKHAEDHGIALGTINSNTFQDDEFSTRDTMRRAPISNLSSQPFCD